MATPRISSIVLAAVIAASPTLASAAQRKLVVGIPPLDVAAVDGVDESVGQVLAKLIRIEMTESARLQPVLLTDVPPKPDVNADGDKPLSSSDGSASANDAIKNAATVRTDVVLIGTVLSAEAEQSSHDIGSPSLLGGNLNVGGRVGRTTATVALHIELVDPKTGDTIDTFDVESKISEAGIGADLQTTAGSFNSGDASFDKAPMGKALREAAQKVAAELTKRADKLTPRFQGPPTI